MKAAVQTEAGAVPRFADFAELEAAAGETIATVEAAAIKQLDRAIAAGTHYSSPRAFPLVCGTDERAALRHRVIEAAGLFEGALSYIDYEAA
jgi:hypothetical protein